MNHLVIFNEEQVRDLLSGKLQFNFRFFKKRPDFLDRVQGGDLVYFSKVRGEVLGQFEIGKLIIAEGISADDWNWIKEIEGDSGLKKGEFDLKIGANKILLIIQITKLKQFITSPIEIDKRSKKGWIVLERRV